MAARALFLPSMCVATCVYVCWLLSARRSFSAPTGKNRRKTFLCAPRLTLSTKAPERLLGQSIVLPVLWYEAIVVVVVDAPRASWCFFLNRR